MNQSNEQRAAYIAALRRERENHERAGNDTGVQDVNVELRRVEGEPNPRKRAEKRPRQTPNRQERRR